MMHKANPTTAGAVPEPAAPCCLRCGYDLRGQPAQGRCPECGLPVRNSTAAPDELRLAPPRWLGLITCGAALLVAGQALFVSGLFCAGRLETGWTRTVEAIDATAAVAIAAG